jgi:hypothetical protein
VTPDEIRAVDRCGYVRSHAEAFAAVAVRNDTVILARSLNRWCTGLIEEGYCSKGFHLKAKTCDWGPMAGFVCEDPCFRKFDRAATESLDRLAAAIAGQQRQNQHSISAHQAGRVPLAISAKRIRYLEIQRVIRIESGRDSRQVMVSADAPYGGELLFQLSYMRHSDRWQIHSVDPQSGRTEPVMGMTNGVTRRFIPGPHDYRAAVTGDYDLAALWPRMRFNSGRWERHWSQQRPVTPLPVSDGGAAAGQYLAHLESRQNHGAEDPDMGNVSRFVVRMIDELNGEIEARSGYRWWMVHHNDEAGNPFSPDIDLPLLGFRPVEGGCRIFAVESTAELNSLAVTLREQHYDAELNPRWRVYSYA